jgi:hypothetical protein
VHVEHLAKEDTERFGDRQQDADVKNELNPTGTIHEILSNCFEAANFWAL